MVRRILTWGTIAFLLFFVAYRPESAAIIAKSVGAGLADIADGFTTWFRSLIS